MLEGKEKTILIVWTKVKEPLGGVKNEILKMIMLHARKYTKFVKKETMKGCRKYHSECF